MRKAGLPTPAVVHGIECSVGIKDGYRENGMEENFSGAWEM